MAEYRGWQVGFSDPGVIHKPIVASADPIPANARPRVLYCVAAGSVTIVDEAGTSQAYPMVAGQTLPFCPYKVTAVSGTIMGWR